MSCVVHSSTARWRGHLYVSYSGWTDDGSNCDGDARVGSCGLRSGWSLSLGTAGMGVSPMALLVFNEPIAAASRKRFLINPPFTLSILEFDPTLTLTCVQSPVQVRLLDCSGPEQLLPGVSSHTPTARRGSISTAVSGG